VLLATHVMRIALLHEHPAWSIDLIDRARVRGLDLTPFDVGEFDFSVDDLGDGFDLWVNRVNAMPSAGRPASIVAAAGHILSALELRGHRVINGSTTHRIGGSKIAQAALFTQLGLGTPPTVGIFQAGDAMAAAERIGFPVLTKPNVGGSGSGIVRHDSAAELAQAIHAGTVDLGIDGTGVVQRIIESTDGMIHRVEMLGSSFFYGTQQPLQVGAFNYCAADGCAFDGGAAIELFTPHDDIIEAAARVMAEANTDIGGVEYIVDATTGQPSYYDFNPYSNFVSGFDTELGFSPIDHYLDFLLAL
jgi:hypothetical protein